MGGHMIGCSHSCRRTTEIAETTEIEEFGILGAKKYHENILLTHKKGVFALLTNETVKISIWNKIIWL